MRSVFFVPVCNFFADRSGGVMTLVAVMLPVLFGVGALAVDVSDWHKEKREMQSAVDAAAMAAVWTVSEGGDATAATLEAKSAAGSHGFPHGGDINVSVAVTANGSTVGIVKPANLFCPT